jgi:hypothetical protein
MISRDEVERLKREVVELGRHSTHMSVVLSLMFSLAVAEAVRNRRSRFRKPKRRSAKTAQENRSPKGRKVSSGSGERPRETEDNRRDQDAPSAWLMKGIPIHGYELKEKFV